MILLPSRVSAFWPFSQSADAASAINISGASTSHYYLKAATNLDPNPNKGLGDGFQTSGGTALLAYAGPSGTIADVSKSAPPDRISVYVVRSGDTLSEIAGMFGVSVNTIIWANNLSSVRDVHTGDMLIILPISGVERTIVKGDTLKSLAKKYGADATEIAQFNGLDPAKPLAIGSTIIIPGGEIAPVTSSAVKISTSKIASNPYVGGSGSIQNGYYSNPVPGAIITQGIHGWNGVDIGAARGTPIHATAGGTVIIARSNGAWNGGYGNYVVITHGNGSQTLYGHMKSVIVSSGQSVSSGQIIGYVGSTGQSTGPHLHFEVRGASNPFRNCRVGGVCSPQ
ncbi:MAG: peptidoglycan DD-metalloendopeptidase family protein [Candidatus Paceibacterota bacterium]